MNTSNGTITALLLWLFVITLGIAFGAGIYEHRMMVPGWLEATADGAARWNGAAARADDTGRRFWAFVTTGPLTLLTVASLFLAWRATGPVRYWWLAAALAALADRLFTFSYFIPTMVGLLEAADSPDAVAKATRWSNLNYLRHMLVLVAWLASLKTLSLLYYVRGQAAACGGGHRPYSEKKAPEKEEETPEGQVR